MHIAASREYGSAAEERKRFYARHSIAADAAAAATAAAAEEGEVDSSIEEMEKVEMEAEGILVRRRIQVRLVEGGMIDLHGLSVLESALSRCLSRTWRRIGLRRW